MSKQELLCWTSLGTSLSVTVIYFLFVFGWPDALPDLTSHFTKIFVNIFWIALAIEIIVGITENRSKVDKDERDLKIESYGYKYAYNFVMIVLVIILGHLFMNMIFSDFSQVHAVMSSIDTVFHILFLTLFLTSTVRRTTMIYQYRKEY